MAPSQPFPIDLWSRILRFLLTKQTGQILINVHRGRVRNWKLTESGGVDDEEAERTFTALAESDRVNAIK